MSAVLDDVETPASGGEQPPAMGRRPFADLAPLLWPTLAAAVNALAFLLFTPNVGDLQAALARAAAARSGVGPGYWFQWFGGGATPGNYSVLVPWLTSHVGVALVAAIATVAITPLVWFAARGTEHRLFATWIAAFVVALNLWSGRVPFAVGTAVAIGAFIALRYRRQVLAVVLAIVSSLCSPVTVAFLAFVLGAAFLVEPGYRRLVWPMIALCGGSLLGIALFFGSPGPQPYPILAAVLEAALAAVWMRMATPAPSLRMALWLTAIAAPLFSLIPNGMGSNWTRMTLIWLPPAVAATAVAVWWRRVLALLPALIMGIVITSLDLSRAADPAASASYYPPLIHQLDQVHGLANYRLEVVQKSSIHTAPYVLAAHVALAGGYETQEQNELNAVLQQPDLNATSYKVWLDNSAVGYVAFDRQSRTTEPEYKLVQSGRLPYLRLVSSNAEWTLYRVGNPTPIVPAPARLLKAEQAELILQVPTTRALHIRVRYSSFLDLRGTDGTTQGLVEDDGSGWTIVRAPKAGTYTLSGSVSKPLR